MGKSPLLKICIMNFPLEKYIKSVYQIIATGKKNFPDTVQIFSISNIKTQLALLSSDLIIKPLFNLPWPMSSHLSLLTKFTCLLNILSLLNFLTSRPEYWWWNAENDHYYSHICTITHKKNSKLFWATNICILCEEFFPGVSFPLLWNRFECKRSKLKFHPLQHTCTSSKINSKRKLKAFAQ